MRKPISEPAPKRPAPKVPLCMTANEIQKKYGDDREKLKTMLDSAPEYNGDPNPGGRPIARGFASFKEYINKKGRPQVTDKKVVVSIRIPSSDAEKLRAMGKGWQTKVGDYIVSGLRQGKIAN